MRYVQAAVIAGILALFFLTSCDEEQSRRLPRHSGKSGEIMLVMGDELWHGPVGDSLRGVLEAFVPLLPQAEPRFSLLRFRLDQMSNLLKQHRNIVELEIDESLDEEDAGVKVIKDKWASHQLVIRARARSEGELIEFISRDFERVCSLIDRTEIERLQKRYEKLNNPEISQLIREKFGIEMRIPTDTEIAKEKNNFIWIKRERTKYKGNTPHEITQGFFIFRYPYRGAESLSEEELLAARDSVLKLHVPGPDPGTYMTTEYRFPPYSNSLNFNGSYAMRTTGLWRVENYFMGGPFTCLTTTSPDGNYVVSISGFVFAPNFPKREFIREVGAVIEGARFVMEDSNSDQNE